MAEKIIILDFGSQYTQLIARRVREQNVYCEIHPYNKVPTFDDSVKGLILSGSPCSVREEEAPDVDITGLEKKFPILGVCFGAQLLAHKAGFEVKASSTREYGRALLAGVENSDKLLSGVEEGSQVWMSHGDTIQNLGAPFKVIAGTDSIGVAAFRHETEEIYALQFHPEVTHSTEGAQILKNFLVDICGCSADWTPDTFVDATVNSLKAQIGNDKVVLGLSGGVDSSVAAMLIHKAIGENLYCIFVDNGLLRKNEFEEVLDSKEKL